MTILRRGDHGEPVERLQRALIQLGHNLLEDGDFGPITDLAVRAFQSAHGLKIDGIVGPVTQHAIVRASAPPAGDSIYVDVMYGLGGKATSSGMDVLAAGVKALSNRFIVSKTVSWSDRDVLASRINKRATTTRNVLLGNSMGANAIPMVTGRCPRHRFDLCVGYDPTWAWDCPPLTKNIARMIHYKGTFLFSLIGKASYTAAFSGQVTVVTTSIPHAWIDDAVPLHSHSLAGALSLLNS